MSRPEPFDVTTIPGIEELARAGQVAPDSDALRTARALLDGAVAAEREGRAGAAPAASAVHAVRSNRRRWVYRGVAVAAAAALIPVGRLALDVARPDVAQVAVAAPRAAVAADGSLTCSGSGYAARIAPRDADLRLLPDELPAGWQLDAIAARWSTSDDPMACSVPALSLLRMDAERVVDGTVAVYGPFAEVDADGFMGARSDVEVGGDPGLLLDSPDLSTQRWVWSDGQHSWLMESRELNRAEGTALAAGIDTDGWAVDWRPTGDLALQVVARRDAPTSGERTAHLDWYLGLTGPDGQAAQLDIKYQPEQPTTVLQAATPGVTISADGAEGRRTEGVQGEQTLTIWRDGLTILANASPGALFAPESGHAADVPIEVLGAIADSLAPAPVDDPRLTEYAFDEATVDHP